MRFILSEKKGLNESRRGSALLVALLIMGILLVVTIALSTLIFRESRITKGLLDSGRAYYAAESGVEIALYNLENRLPGWEPEQGRGFFGVDENKSAVGEFVVRNRCNSYPCFDEEDFDVASAAANPEVFYDVLELNESINIPLFIVEDGEEVPVENFVVQFFTLFDPSEVLRIESDDDVMKNVMRWKVFGIPEDSRENLRTEAISGYTALSNITYGMHGVGEEFFRTRAEQPSWFGTMDCFEGEERFMEKGISCIPHDAYRGVCRFDEAKEFYEYDQEGHVEAIHDCYPISDFMGSHRLNYLSLTNLINPDLFKQEGVDAVTDLEKEMYSKIYFRVELFGEEEGEGETVREVAEITSSGYSGDSRKSINVRVRRGSFMPVFYFSVYSTYESAL